ncbi:pirin family protein [Methylobacterium nigriterrae]|uniref:pirin family protein n=1 Tax=Methylobacterium nigriterrae TaxID=3127512 RepID=UPI003013F489
MIEHRPFDALGSAESRWLTARLHFAFAGMGNLEHRPIGPLRVWNDDEFAPGSGFPMHAHQDVEIVTYVREGAVTHEDSLGNRGRVEAGDVQVMSAGSGIRHAEFNAEPVPLRLFQIWLDPREPGGMPRWASRRFPASERGGHFAVLASGDPADEGALPINAAARVMGATLNTGEWLGHELASGHRGYLVTTGPVCLNGLELSARDGVAIHEVGRLNVLARSDAELVLVELL